MRMSNLKELKETEAKKKKKKEGAGWGSGLSKNNIIPYCNYRKSYLNKPILVINIESLNINMIFRILNKSNSYNSNHLMTIIAYNQN